MDCLPVESPAARSGTLEYFTGHGGVLRFAKFRHIFAIIHGRLLSDAAFFDATSPACDNRLATAADGVRALAVCDAVRRASASHRAEALGLKVPAMVIGTSRTDEAAAAQYSIF